MNSSARQTLFSRGGRGRTQAPSEEALRVTFDLRRIGEILRQTRIEKGLSLHEVSDPLLLTKSTLDAIESGCWDTLPHPVYVKGYVKSYATYLDVSTRIEEYLHPLEAPQAGNRESLNAQGQVKKTREEQWTNRQRTSPLKNLALLCSSFVGLALGIAITPALQETSSTGFKGLVAALRLAVTSL